MYGFRVPKFRSPKLHRFCCIILWHFFFEVKYNDNLIILLLLLLLKSDTCLLWNIFFIVDFMLWRLVYMLTSFYEFFLVLSWVFILYILQLRDIFYYYIFNYTFTYIMFSLSRIPIKTVSDLLRLFFLFLFNFSFRIPYLSLMC